MVSALLQKNPLMVYAGQEYGEHGMDQEGFSGHDGRTTIFDYWAVDTLTRAAKKQLTDEEQQLAEVYKKVLMIASKEKAVIEGNCFDLMYVNQQFHRQYMFLRKAKKRQLQVVANFDDIPVEIDVNIPAHAFEYLNMAEGVYTAKDLLSGNTTMLDLKADSPVNVHVEARSAVVLLSQIGR